MPTAAEEISGIFIKSIAVGSVAEQCQKIQVNDQIIEVDGRSLFGFNNLQAVDLLKSTGKVVKLKLARYLKGKFDAISVEDEPSPVPVSASLPSSFSTPRYMNGSTVIEVNNDAPASGNSFDGSPIHASNSREDAIAKWAAIIGTQHDILVSFALLLRVFGVP